MSMFCAPAERLVWRIKEEKYNKEKEEFKNEKFQRNGGQEKSAAEAHRLLLEAYGEAALSETSCREWFQKFKNGEFDVEDKERSGKPKVYEDAELEALLNEDSCQTQKELALTLGVTTSNFTSFKIN
ncbi:MOS1T transposase, partial [Pseudoatta argentina]